MKIAFLDRDGTINVDKKYLYKIEDFEFLPGAIEGMKRLSDLGYRLIIITNQSGIARGYYSVNDMQKLHQWMQSQLEKKGVAIEAIYYCPHLTDANVLQYRITCNCRKPKTQLYHQAISDLYAKYKEGITDYIAIGDKLRDLSICDELGCSGYLIESGSVIKELSKRITSVKSILEAANIIDKGL